MAHYLYQAAYTPEAWAAQLQNPQNRVELIRPLLEKVGARIESFYYTFGDYDILVIGEAPDNVSAAAIAMAVTASGSFKAFKTSPLMTLEEGMAAMRTGGEVGTAYRPPTA